MNNPAPRSLHCRHCRADNPAGSIRCWLCDAADWSPAVRGATLKTATQAPASGGSGSGMVRGLTAVTIFLVGVMILVAIGIGQASLGLAYVVILAWWMSLGFAVFSHFQRERERGTCLTVFVAIFIALWTFAVVVVSVFLLLLFTCQVGGPRNFH